MIHIALPPLQIIHLDPPTLLLLDASKAFDRVHYCKLFKMLRDRTVCPVVLRFIVNMYINQIMQVNWNTSMSYRFNEGNSVKQGGVLSPILFTVYLDGLIKRLKYSKLGCHIGNVMGAFCYADDVSLVYISYCILYK